MKTYIYTYRRVKNDVNGNPRHWVTIYRVKRNQPIQLCADRGVGYKGTHQIICEIIAEVEKWGREKHSYTSGFNRNGVQKAERAGDIRIIQI